MVHLVHDTNGGRQSYQSTWMSRWMRTSCNMTGKSLDYATVNDLNRIAKDILVTSRSVKGLGMIETVTSELVNGGQRPSTESLRNERSCSYLFKDGQENDDKGASAHEGDHKFECGEATSKNYRLDHANLRILQHKGGHSASSDKALHMEVNSDSSSSKAPGQEVEITMECADQTKQKSNLCLYNSPKAEPGFRWVKSLKLSSSHSSARGTKSINLSEDSSRKRNSFFSRSLKSDITRSESMAMDDSIKLIQGKLG